MDTLRKQLISGCEQIGLELSQHQYDLLMGYLQLLVKWNRAYNLTAVRDPEQMVSRHLLDSLVLAQHLPGQRILDVGSGAGLPGIPMAIVFPERHFSLLDSNGKKSRFQLQAKHELGLDNIDVLQARVEQLHCDGEDDKLKVAPFTTIMCRAFSSLVDMVTGSQQLLEQDGQWLAMKGVYPHEELEQMLEKYPNMKIHHHVELHVPYADGERNLMVLKAS